ncbi:hypothetical protein STAS_02548 [Striga asiatica]|uniref:Chloroplast thylakoid membrane n=1 Tax=Striga asiatica TaxID=4170 RepID=A0A5A7P2X1_STRAF|nr:hypothetical protein STAS_02548 [Striga asiatica]
MSPPLVASLISSSPAVTSPAPPPIPPHCPSHHYPAKLDTISRRDAAILLSSAVVTPFLQPPRASALSIGISGPKEWLKEQKKKSAGFLLAPVNASRNILQSAYLLLNKSELGENDMEELRKLLVSAARDCVPQDRNSFVEFQANTGVEVCTFRLIVKNASSLLADRDPIKSEAESKLNDLIRSFSSLNGMARENGTQLASNRKKIGEAIKDTVSSLNDFEQGIKDCLQV